MVVFVCLCQVSPYQATSDMPMPMHNSSKMAWLQVGLLSRGVIEVVKDETVDSYSYFLMYAFSVEFILAIYVKGYLKDNTEVTT